MFPRILAIVLLLAFPELAGASLETCVRACLDDPLPTPTEPTTPVTPTAKVFPGTITFDNTSDQGAGPYYGTACVLFPAIWEGRIKTVDMNGETAFHGTSYNGRPVFRLLKTGDKYTRPLKFTITSTDGQVYTATSGSAAAPAGKNAESAKPSSCGNPDGANCRQNMRFKHPGSYYGTSPTVDCDGTKYAIKNSSKRQEEAGGWIWKPVSDSNGNLVIVGRNGKKYQSCTVIW